MNKRDALKLRPAPEDMGNTAAPTGRFTIEAFKPEVAPNEPCVPLPFAAGSSMQRAWRGPSFRFSLARLAFPCVLRPTWASYS